MVKDKTRKEAWAEKRKAQQENGEGETLLTCRARTHTEAAGVGDGGRRWSGRRRAAAGPEEANALQDDGRHGRGRGLRSEQLDRGGLAEKG